jgi:threonine dehydratase
MVHSIRDKTCYTNYPSLPSICDALIGGVGDIPYLMANQCIDDIITVSEDTIRKAIVELLENDKVVAEPAGAATYAAIIENPNYFMGKKVAAIISGGNLDENLMRRLFR